MKNFVHPGEYVPVAAPYNVLSGEGCLVGSLFGVASVAALSTEIVEIAVVGVYDLKKTSLQAWTVGARIYWDDTAKECTTTASTNKLIGVAVAVAANPTPVGRVRLSANFTL